MNFISFILLIKNIFSKKPDIKKIQKQGLLAVKIAQVFALRIDFLSEESCIELSKLFSQNFNSNDLLFDEIIEKYVDKQWINNFKSIEKTPIASASIGQVHKAVLLNGEIVAIKIVKKDFSEIFLKDIIKIEKFLKIIIFFYPKLEKVANPLAVLEAIKKTTISELNLLNEISNAEILNIVYEKYKGDIDISRFALPKYYKELSNENILVSEFIKGDNFDTLLENKKMSYDLLLDFFRIHGLFMFGEGVFHGDVHPGNIILRNEKIYLIDNGAISETLKSTRNGLFEFFENLVIYDYKKCADAIVNMSTSPIKNREKYSKEFELLYQDFRGKNVSQVSLTKQMMDTIKLAVHNGATFNDDMYPIIKSLMYLDGMVIKCKSDANLIKDLAPFIKDFKKFIN
ncbi:MAG: AarF/ABC1/UbiB kinase family protein [Candidatus Gracilibacteria bacterium]|nr:AarF/ABC1/UbiB kinase family protein [Candidatus Gracilibacteria bacterium]